MDDRASEFSLNLIETRPSDLESWRRMSAMSDAELRGLVDADDHPMFAEAIEAIIERRRAADPASR